MGGACRKPHPAPEQGQRVVDPPPAEGQKKAPPSSAAAAAAAAALPPSAGACKGTVAGTTLLHFNDVYNIEKSPRFVAKLLKARETETAAGRDVYTLFAGDAFSPSIMSTIMRGKQMVPVLNALGIDAACLGNHDLDFGIEDFRALKDECNFPWICSNAKFRPTGEQLGGCHEYLVLAEAGKPKVLVLGLIEPGWIATLSSIEPEEVDYEDFSAYAARRVPELTAQHGGFDAVVAMSHMRMPHDFALADACGGAAPILDIVLGGHDHHYEDVVRNGIRVLNSGCDFKTFTTVRVEGREGETPTGGGRAPMITTAEMSTVENDDPEDEATAALVNELKAEVEKSMDNAVGFSKVGLDARFSEIRTRETNISNFIATLMTRATDAEIAILNSGTIRADKIVPKGTITVRDCCELLPMADELSVISLTAAELLKALENGVSQYPAMEGRFPCVDGVRFSFDPDAAPGARVVSGSVYVRVKIDTPEAAPLPPHDPPADDLEAGDTVPQDYLNACADPLRGFEPLDMARSYTVVSKTYLLQGKDGYDVFQNAPVVRTAEDCPVLPTVLRNVFTELGVLRRWAGLTLPGVLPAAAIFRKNAGQRCSLVDPFAIAPLVDGRITNIAEAPVVPFTADDRE